MARVMVDQEACLGCGACVSICPDVFEIGDDGKSHVKKITKIPPCAKEAAESCPAKAISIE
ncbi:MAG: ferredoxin [archaeon]